MENECRQIVLRCEDCQEALIFKQYISYNPFLPDEINFGTAEYEIVIEEDYVGDCRGLFNRIKRAWKTLWGKPIIYTGVYYDDEEQIRKFLTDCLDVVGD